MSVAFNITAPERARITVKSISGNISVRDIKGDLTSIEAAAQSLQAKKVDVILSLATSVTLAVKRATKSVPIVFYGSAPVVLEKS